MESFDQAWELVGDYCRERITEIAYNTWFSRLQPVSLDFDRGLATIQAPNEFHRQTILRFYSDLLRDALKNVFGAEVDFALEVAEEKPAAAAPREAAPEGGDELTFENFVVGPSNRFAHAACQAVAAQPALIYNPLFIYGSPGLGKTHLLNAVTKEFQKNFPQRVSLYIKGEDFANEVIEGIRTGTMPAIREKYRTVDLLLFDDVQFIAGKESTQEEFFHTFETLHEAKKQIVLTSDRPPKEIATLEERLKSRFESGLLADIQAPELETRIAIINRKAESLDFQLPPAVAEYIAKQLKNNIRQLEGAVKKLRAFHILEDKPLNVATAQAAISDIINDSQPTPVTVEKIIEEVARTFGNLTPEDIRSQRRNANISEARQISMYIIREITDLSMVEIGQIFGGRDHSTVVYATRQVETRMARDPRTRDLINDIIKNIRDR